MFIFSRLEIDVNKKDKFLKSVAYSAYKYSSAMNVENIDGNRQINKLSKH